MCKDHADDLVIQCHFASIAEKRSLIEQTRRSIGEEHCAIRELIKNGASSGDAVTDIIYLIGHDTDQCPGLRDAFNFFVQALNEHPGEFIVIEDITLRETFHGGPGAISPFPPAEEKLYIAGIIPAIGTIPFILEPPCEPSKHPRVLCKLLHAPHIHFPIELLGKLNEMGDRTKISFFFSDSLEPEAISYSYDKRIRFWIGNDAVAYCLASRIISEPAEARQLRKSILTTIEQFTEPLPNPANLSDELSDKLGFYKSKQDQPVAHSAT